jgi:prophage regulatory protein
MKKKSKALAEVNNRQPLHASQLQDALLTIKTVMATTGLSRSTVYARMNVGTFPQKVKLSTRCVRWTSRSIQEWINTVATSAE